jgi:hypothetical protein
MILTLRTAISSHHWYSSGNENRLFYIQEKHNVQYDKDRIEQVHAQAELPKVFATQEVTEIE